MSGEQDYLAIASGPRTGEKIGLTGLPASIGRQAPADIVIEMPSVSRQHARISQGAAGYVIEDLGSRDRKSVV